MRLMNARRTPGSRSRTGRLAGPLVAIALLMAVPAPGQEPGALARIRSLDVDRLEDGPVTVLYSAHEEQGGGAGEAAARRVAARFRDAAEFFIDRLGGDFGVTLALLSPRDWHQVGGARHAVPWHSRPDRLVVVPVRADIGLLQTGRDSARTRRVLDIVALHQLGHIVTAAYYEPAGFREPRPPVLWFDELLASYVAEAYMRAREPELAEFAEELAEDVTRRTTPRFSGLRQYDEYHDAFLESPIGANTLGWYQNAFNREAARLYRRHGTELLGRIREELPWRLIESWTTDDLLEWMEALSPGFRAWAEEMAAWTRPRTGR